MPIDDAMTIDERRKYLSKMKSLYLQADRQQRGELLATMEQVTGMHRKSLTRLLNAPTLQRQPRTTPRSRTYGPDVEAVVITVWESLDSFCAERLTPTLSKTAAHLARFGVLTIAPETLEQLDTVSRATVERMLSRHRSHRLRLPQRGPDQANRVTKGVPMGRIPWDIKEPGHFEVDLVHHSGPTSLGEYLHMLQMVDVATGWATSSTELRPHPSEAARVRMGWQRSERKSGRVWEEKGREPGGKREKRRRGMACWRVEHWCRW